MTELSEEFGPVAREESPQIQKVSLQSKGIVTVPDEDPRVASLVRMGLTEVEARSAVSAVAGMW